MVLGAARRTGGCDDEQAPQGPHGSAGSGSCATPLLLCISCMIDPSHRCSAFFNVFFLRKAMVRGLCTGARALDLPEGCFSQIGLIAANRANNTPSPLV